MAFRVYLWIIVLAWFEVIELNCLRTFRSLGLFKHFFILGLMSTFLKVRVALLQTARIPIAEV
jgi:hypothetical protein